MERISLTPRQGWDKKVTDLGFSFHTIQGDLYWDESACYSFSAQEIDMLEEATAELEQLCLEVVDKVISQDLYHRLAIPDQACALIDASWKNGHKNLYGRFDFSYSGEESSPPKLLEYNADTPTSLFEASVVQWQWLEDVIPDGDQFNSIHEKLIDAWKGMNFEDPTVYFTCMGDHEEDRVTVEYLRDTALQAGLQVPFIDLRDIGWDGDSFVDLEDRPIDTLFKLYPWEWMLKEEFGSHIIDSSTLFIEPAWKMILSNKGLLALLWEHFPNHPNLLPSFFDKTQLQGKSVRKPLLSREGANISFISQEQGGGDLVTAGPYGAEGYVYQEQCSLPNFDGHYPVIGSWVIASEPAGIGIREDRSPITGNDSRFIPHYFS